MNQTHNFIYSAATKLEEALQQMIFKLNLTIDFNFLTVFFLNFSSYLLRDHAWLYIYFIHIDRSLHSKFLNMFNLMKKWKCIYCKRKRCSVKSPTWLLIRLLSTVFWFTVHSSLHRGNCLKTSISFATSSKGVWTMTFIFWHRLFKSCIPIVKSVSLLVTCIFALESFSVYFVLQ